MKCITKAFLLLLCFVQLQKQDAKNPEFLASLQRVFEYKKLSLSALLFVPLIHQLYAKSQVKIIKDKDDVYEASADPWTIFNRDAAGKNLVFYFPGHKSFAQLGVFQQTIFGGNPLTEQFKLAFGWSKEKPEEEICEIMLRFEETILNKEYRTYFGQKGDVMYALRCLKENYRKNEKINIVGRSRGGHVAAIVIGLLCSPNHSWLTEVGITEEIRKVILEKLQEGQIILSVPLIDIAETLKETRGFLCGRIVHFGFLPIISGLRYRPFGISAIPFLDNISTQPGFENPNFKITVIFANDDRTVGVNENFRERFILALGEFGEVERIDVPGGHNDRFQRSTLLRKIVSKIIHQESVE